MGFEQQEEDAEGLCSQVLAALDGHSEMGYNQAFLFHGSQGSVSWEQYLWPFQKASSYLEQIIRAGTVY